MGKRENPRLNLLMGRFLGRNIPQRGSKADAFMFLIKTSYILAILMGDQIILEIHQAKYTCEELLCR